MGRTYLQMSHVSRILVLMSCCLALTASLIACGSDTPRSDREIQATVDAAVESTVAARETKAPEASVQPDPTPTAIDLQATIEALVESTIIANSVAATVVAERVAATLAVPTPEATEVSPRDAVRPVTRTPLPSPTRMRPAPSPTPRFAPAPTPVPLHWDSTYAVYQEHDFGDATLTLTQISFSTLESVQNSGRTGLSSYLAQQGYKSIVGVRLLLTNFGEEYVHFKSYTARANLRLGGRVVPWIFPWGSTAFPNGGCHEADLIFGIWERAPDEISALSFELNDENHGSFEFTMDLSSLEKQQVLERDCLTGRAPMRSR